MFRSDPLQMLDYRQMHIINLRAGLDFQSSFLSTLLLLSSSLPAAATLPDPCISCFSHCCDKIPDQGILQRGEVVLAHSLRVYSSAWWRGQDRDGNSVVAEQERQLVTSQPQLGSEGDE